jgi:hypothetical protein
VTVLLFLNELSCVSQPVDLTSHGQAWLLVDDLVDILVRIRKRRPDVALVSAARLYEIKLGDDYVFTRWAADNRNRDRLRFLKSVQNRAPFRSLGQIDADGALVYLVDGAEAEGLGYAHVFDSLALSIRSDLRWDLADITLTRQELTENGDHEPVVTEAAVTVRHAARPDHVAAHQGWLAVAGMDDIRTADALWSARSGLFPHLLFLPRVLADLGTLDPVRLKVVRDLLARLEGAMARWDPNASPEPDWKTKVTPEHEKRRLLCRFPDLDGVVRVFDLHARFTPGAGRLHFRLDASSQTIIVAYVGKKIERRSGR